VGGARTGGLMTQVVNHPGRYWHALDDGRIQCDLCPRSPS
jgi:hypothetical protein